MENRFPVFTYLMEARSQEAVMVQRTSVMEDFPAHGHDYYEMELILEGEGEQVVNHRTLALTPGSLYVLSPLDFHRLEVRKPLQLLSIHFLPEMAEQMGFGQVQEAHAMRLSLPQVRLYEELLRPLADGTSGLYTAQELQGVAMLMLAQLLREGETCFLSKPARKMQPALKYIQAHHGDPELRLADAAKVCGLTPCYFSALFHQTVGRPFADYLTEYRLLHVCALLRSTELPIGEIAYESGFSSLAHFFRVFKKAYGCSPGAYRIQSKR